MPLSHGPGQAQGDFGEAVAVISGVECKVHYFVPDLPHSDGCFVKADPAETTEAFLDGHVSAFAFLGGAPQSILYDNTRLAVARTLHKSLGDGRRKRTRSFTELEPTTFPPPVRGPVRKTRQGQRPGEDGGDGGLRTAQLLGAGAVLPEF